MKKFYLWVISFLLFAPTDVQPSIKQDFKEKSEIAQHRFQIAKKILRAPFASGLSMAPLFVFAYYAPRFVAGMGPMSAIATVGIGGLFAGLISAEVSFLFNKQ